MRRTLELFDSPPSGKAVERMTPKGHSPVDLESAQTATSRRSLVGALGVAGLASAAALAVARPVSAAPYSPSAEDSAKLALALQIELAAKLLYRDALAAGLTDAAAEVAQTFGENHEAYADQFAAITGISADTYDEAFYEERKDQFATNDVAEFAQAAWELENSFAATYTELFTSFESIGSQTVVASIVVINGRMATVLADLAALSSDFNILFDPPAEIITLPEPQQS
jgi:hypothetical protein